MKLSETKTPYIVFKADAFDEWTMINCAIVKIANIAGSLINADATVRLLKTVTDFWNISFWCSEPDFLYIDPGEHEWIDELNDNKTWSFLEITGGELDDLLSRREHRTESGQLTIDADHSLRFHAYVKHTDIEIATEHFTLAQLGVETGN